MMVGDIETYRNTGGTMVPYLLSIYNNKLEKSFYGENCVDLFIEFIINNKIKIYYFHNLNFDGKIIINKINTCGHRISKIDLINNENNLYAIIIKLKDRRLVELRCSYRIIPLSIKEMAETFNLSTNKWDFPHDYINQSNIFKIIKKKKNDRNPFWLKYSNQINVEHVSKEYCINDCRIAYLSLVQIIDELKFYELNLLEENIYSISSIALKIFDSKFNTYKISLSNKIYDERIRLGYYGGRCEVFGNKTKKIVKHFDFPSMYPSCMLGIYPNDSGIYKEFNYTPTFFDIGMYEIIYESNMEIPILPIRHGNKLKFVNGNYLRGVHFSEEINFFIKNGGKIVKVLWGIVYYNTCEPFKEYVTHFTDLKNKSSHGKKVLYKLMLNSLYGKFGTSNSSTTLYVTKTKNSENFFKIVKKNIYTEIKKSNVIIAAITASRARIKLYRGFTETIDNGGKLLYCDTDSIFACFNEEPKINENSLIKWDSKNLKNTLFLMPKVYFIGASQKIKGIKILNFEKNIIRPKMHNKQMIFKNQWRIKYIDSYPHWQIYNKKLLINYDKRRFLDNKYLNTKPIKLVWNLNKYDEE